MNRRHDMTEAASTKLTQEAEAWPVLSYPEWKDTYATLHLWSQVVGKLRLVQTPWVNHSWHVVYYVTSRGLTTSPIPNGPGSFQIDFDFVEHRLQIETSEGNFAALPLRPMTVADFYREVMAKLAEVGVAARIRTMPSEIPDAIPFDQDTQHKSYDAAQAHRFWRALSQADRVLKKFRAGFLGKNSPVHFFWGGFDLAVTRFSGRTAPPHPGGIPHLPDWVAKEAYSHEVSSAGFWPGGEMLPETVFYSYAYPEPPGYNTTPVRPSAGRWDPTLREFILPYDEVRRAADPDAMLLEFLQSTYEAAADCAHWDRAALERMDRR
jgi:hypothetical protein